MFPSPSLIPLRRLFDPRKEEPARIFSPNGDMYGFREPPEQSPQGLLSEAVGRVQVEMFLDNMAENLHITDPEYIARLRHVFLDLAGFRSRAELTRLSERAYEQWLLDWVSFRWVNWLEYREVCYMFRLLRVYRREFNEDLDWS